MKRIVLVLLILSLLAAGVVTGCGSGTQAPESQEPDAAKTPAESALVTRENGVLTIGFCASFPPFESRKGPGEFEGFDVDLGAALAEKLGLTPKFVDAEWQGLVPGLKKGDFDVLITCMAASEARGETVSFTDPYYQLGSVVVVRQDEENIKSRDDLPGKIVGVQLGTADEMAAEKISGIKELRKFNNLPEVALDLESKRIDAAVMSYPYALNLIREGKPFKIAGPQFDEVDIVMVVNDTNTALTEALNKALAELKADGTYDQLIAKWLELE